MPECEEECHVHHLDQELTKDEEKFDRNELEDRLNDRFNSVSSEESLRTFDGVHMDGSRRSNIPPRCAVSTTPPQAPLTCLPFPPGLVADYMDSTMRLPLLAVAY